MNLEANQQRRIGVIASATGLTPDAIRYYERVGLVPKPIRTEGGFRLYPADTIARIRFIQQAQRLGLELKEIRDLLRPANGRRKEQCQHVRNVLAKHQTDVETRMRELQAYRDMLQGALAQCDRALRMKETIPCPVVTELESNER